MNREELEGVIGHEMSHIKNHDIRPAARGRHDDRNGRPAGKRPVEERIFRWHGTGRRNSGVLLLVFFAGARWPSSASWWVR